MKIGASWRSVIYAGWLLCYSEPPRNFIQSLFENLPDMEIRTHPERFKQMLPWGKLIQENFA